MLSKSYIAIFILLIGALPGLVVAETVYVNDTLRVGVRSGPNSSSTPHAVVVTGMQLEVLDHQDGYIKIRSDQGIEGWIKETYVTTEKPAKLQLAELQAQQSKLTAQLGETEKQLTKEQARTQTLTRQLKSEQEKNAKLSTHLTQTRAATKSSSNQHFIAYAIILLVLMLGAFIAGALWHRRLAMRRLGGLRV